MDIREWDENHERMSKGITLTEDDAKKLVKLLTDEFTCTGDEPSDKQLILEIKDRLEMLLGRDPGESEVNDDDINEFYEEATNLWEAIGNLGF